MTQNELDQCDAMGECLELVLNQRTICSVWRWESPDGGFWSIDLVKAPDAIGLLADMLDGLEDMKNVEKLEPTQYTRDWFEVEKYVIHLMTSISKTKRC